MPSTAIRWALQSVTSWPRKRTRPAVLRCTPLSRSKRVLLPAPFGPISPTMPPSWIAKDTLLTACRPPNHLFNPSTSSRAAIRPPYPHCFDCLPAQLPASPQRRTPLLAPRFLPPHVNWASTGRLGRCLHPFHFAPLDADELWQAHQPAGQEDGGQYQYHTIEHDIDASKGSGELCIAQLGHRNQEEPAD